MLQFCYAYPLLTTCYVQFLCEIKILDSLLQEVWLPLPGYLGNNKFLKMAKGKHLNNQMIRIFKTAKFSLLFYGVVYLFSMSSLFSF